MRMVRIFESICKLLSYAEDKGLELDELVVRNYFDTDFMPLEVRESKNYIENKLEKSIAEFETFYDLICALDKKYQLVYNKEDRLMVLYSNREYKLYYITEENIRYERYMIGGEDKYA